MPDVRRRWNRECRKGRRYCGASLSEIDGLPGGKNIAAAEKEFRRAIELDPNYLPAYSAYAALLAGQNRTDEAIAQYKKAT